MRSAAIGWAFTISAATDCCFRPAAKWRCAWLPLHRGPHRTYNALVAERVGQIESTWTALRSKAPERARDQAFMRLTLLKRALRRRLLRPDRPRLRLNRQDPLGASLDFAEIDAMAEMLWAGTTSVNVQQ